MKDESSDAKAQPEADPPLAEMGLCPGAASKLRLWSQTVEKNPSAEPSTKGGIVTSPRPSCLTLLRSVHLLLGLAPRNPIRHADGGAVRLGEIIFGRIPDQSRWLDTSL
jgi:hypothetical protein